MIKKQTLTACIFSFFLVQTQIMHSMEPQHKHCYKEVACGAGLVFLLWYFWPRTEKNIQNLEAVPQNNTLIPKIVPFSPHPNLFIQPSVPYTFDDDKSAQSSNVLISLPTFSIPHTMWMPPSAESLHEDDTISVPSSHSSSSLESAIENDDHRILPQPPKEMPIKIFIKELRRTNPDRYHHLREQSHSQAANDPELKKAIEQKRYWQKRYEASWKTSEFELPLRNSYRNAHAYMKALRAKIRYRIFVGLCREVRDEEVHVKH